jgi:uncharacterized protein YbjT (DUF2867 family)
LDEVTTHCKAAACVHAKRIDELLAETRPQPQGRGVSVQRYALAPLVVATRNVKLRNLRELNLRQICTFATQDTASRRKLHGEAMFVVLGATGHIGSVVTKSLLKEGQRVTAIVRDDKKAEGLKSLGAKTAVVDVRDHDALREVLRQGRRAFLLNPPAPTNIDTDKQENETASSIALALDGSGLEKVLVASTYGAQPGGAIGDLSVLYDFEAKVCSHGIPTAINRGAYYFTNLDMLVDGAIRGEITTMFPAYLQIPMVAPSDIGAMAAERLTSPLDDVGVRYVEGPERYSFAAVAYAFSRALDHPVNVRIIDREDWEAGFIGQGFSEAAARSYVRMIAASVDGFEMPESPMRGSTDLETYIRGLTNS